MAECIDKLTEARLVNAIEGNMDEVLLAMGRLSHVELHEDDEVACLLTGIPFGPFNQVFRSRISPTRIDARVRQITQLLNSRELPGLWPVWPSSHPGDLAVHLERNAWTHGGDSVGMVLDLSEIREPRTVPQDLAIDVVEDEAQMKSWAGVAFPPPLVDRCSQLLTSLGIVWPWRHYLGLHDRQAVACSQLFFGAGVAGLYLVRTVPDARRQGFGTAVTLRALLDARDMGCRFAVLTSSPLGESVYRRLGFTEYCRIAIYESPSVSSGD